MKLRAKIEAVTCNSGHSLTVRATCHEVTAYGASYGCADTFVAEFTVLNRVRARETFFVGRELVITVEPQ
jgi:hypothetical protein